jgi:hypothetical protein
MQYLRHDVVQPVKEPHIKSTGVRKKKAREAQPIYGSKHHIRDHPRLRASAYYKALQWKTPRQHVRYCNNSPKRGYTYF